MVALFLRTLLARPTPAVRMLDTHCHILPGLDDGACDMVEAVAIAERLSALGITQVAATPHVMSDLFPRDSATIIDATASLNTELRARGIPVEVLPGAEYYAEPDLLARIALGDVLSFLPQRYVLFELPLATKPRFLEEIVFQLRTAHYVPLLTHVERYLYLRASPDDLARLRHHGVRFQVNYASLTKSHRSRSGSFARWLVRQGWADEFGSDLHHPGDALGVDGLR